MCVIFCLLSHCKEVMSFGLWEVTTEYSSLITPVAESLPLISNPSIKHDIFFCQHALGTPLFIVMYLLISCERVLPSCKMVVFVNNIKVCFTQLIWKWKSKAVPAYGWNKKKDLYTLHCRGMEKKKKRTFFSSFFHIEWLNFTLHWHIWGDAPWNQSNFGISEDQYFETSWEMWPYYSLHLSTDYTIMWQWQKVRLR